MCGVNLPVAVMFNGNRHAAKKARDERGLGYPGK